MTLQDGQLLYHGSYMPIPNIDLTFGEDGKDFGKGFYVTTDEEQAVSFIRLSVRKAIAAGRIPSHPACGYLSVYRYHAAEQLVQYEFETTDCRWLQFVAGNRLRDFSGFHSAQQLLRILESDMIGGKIANDATNRVLVTYMAGTLGDLNDEDLIQLTVKRLKPEVLKDQWCFKTPLAVSCLETVEVRAYEL